MALDMKVIEIVAEQLGIGEEEIQIDSKFVEDLGADSLDIVEVLLALEEEFEVEISDDEAQKIKTVGELIQFIESSQFSKPTHL